MNFLDSKTFCPLPWVNISADTDGNVRLCCVSDEYMYKENGENYNLGYDKVEEVINSPCMKRIRQDMLDGKQISGCKNCYAVENSNGVSYRNIYARLWRDDESFIRKYEQSQTGDIDPTVEYYDLRYGNLCNLSCRSCYPGASSQFNKDIKELHGKTTIFKFHSINDKDLNSWYETDIFDYNLDSQLPYIKEYYCTGGEPTLIEKNYEILTRMIEQGYSKKCILKLSTNLTNTKKDFYSLMPHFKKIILLGSIDGYGSMQEYLRYPSNWGMISNNISLLMNMNLSNLNVIMTPVIQKTNLGYITDLFEYFESFNRIAGKMVIHINPIVLADPSYLDFEYLPTDYKLRCWSKIEDWINNKCKYQTIQFKQIMNQVKSKCQTFKEYDENLSKFFEFNDIFDKHRNQSIDEINPELSSFRII